MPAQWSLGGPSSTLKPAARSDHRDQPLRTSGGKNCCKSRGISERRSRNPSDRHQHYLFDKYQSCQRTCRGLHYLPKPWQIAGDFSSIARAPRTTSVSKARLTAVAVIGCAAIQRQPTMHFDHRLHCQHGEKNSEYKKRCTESARQCAAVVASTNRTVHRPPRPRRGSPRYHALAKRAELPRNQVSPTVAKMAGSGAAVPNHPPRRTLYLHCSIGRMFLPGKNQANPCSCLPTGPPDRDRHHEQHQCGRGSRKKRDRQPPPLVQSRTRVVSKMSSR